MLLLKMYGLRKVNSENQNFENRCLFSLVFVKNSKIHTYDV